jgi:hypothetical protein
MIAPTFLLTTYRVFSLGKDGRVLSKNSVQCADEVAAFRRLKSTLGRNAIEICHDGVVIRLVSAE